MVIAALTINAKSGVLILASLDTIESGGREVNLRCLIIKGLKMYQKFLLISIKKDAFECRLWSADCGILRPAGGDGVNSAGV